MENKGQDVKYAVLHTGIFYPGVGQFGPTLTTSDSAGSKGVKMTLSENESFVTLEAKDKVGKTQKILVPINQFTHLVLS